MLLKLNYEEHFYREGDIHPVMSNTRDDGRQLLAESASANARPHTKVYPLEEANRALQDMKADRINGTGVLRLGVPSLRNDRAHCYTQDYVPAPAN